MDSYALERKYVENNLSLAKSFDPRMDFGERKKYTVVTGIANLLPYTNIATGSSVSTVNHTFQTSDNFAFDRRMLLKWYVELTITGTSPAGKLLQLGTNDGIRCMPISSMITNGTVTLNGFGFSTQLSQYIQAVNRYEETMLEDGFVSMSPSMPDQYQQYADYTVYGVNRNPLGRYGTNTTQIPRGGHPIEVVSDNGTTAVVRFVVTEPLRISPMTWDEYDEPALIGVNSVNLNLQLGDFSRMWCHAYSAGYTITAISGQFYQNCEVQYNVITPDTSVVIDRSRNYFYPYNTFLRLETGGSSLAPGASGTTTSQAFQLDCVPNRVWVYARQRDSDLLDTSSAWYNSDSFAKITSMNVTFNGVSGLLASASPEQLYQMSRKNGLNMSWPQYDQYCGAPVCFAFGSDIGLGNQLLAVGSKGNYQLQVQATYLNTNTSSNPTPSTTINYNLYVVVMRDGVVSSFNSVFSSSVGVLDRSDVYKVISSPDIPYIPFHRGRVLYGKGFFDDLWSGLKGFFKSVPKIAQQALPIAQQLAPLVAPGIGPALAAATPLINLAAGSGVTGGAVTGGARRGRPKGSKNKPKRGGRISSPEELLELLQG